MLMVGVLAGCAGTQGYNLRPLPAHQVQAERALAPYLTADPPNRPFVTVSEVRQTSHPSTIEMCGFVNARQARVDGYVGYKRFRVLLVNDEPREVWLQGGTRDGQTEDAVAVSRCNRVPVPAA